MFVAKTEKGVKAMSLAKNASERISEQEYLEGEKVSKVRHEYIDGYVYAMSGTSKNHNIIVGNVLADFKNILKQKQSPCKTFSENVKVRAYDIDSKFFYPDVVVTCDTEDNESEYYINSPVIIVEVLSKSTREYDLTTKKLHYFNIQTLQEYVVIEQDICQIEVFSRNGDVWESNFYFLGNSITFESIDVTLSVEDIYYQVDNDNIVDYLKKKEQESEEAKD